MELECCVVDHNRLHQLSLPARSLQVLWTHGNSELKISLSHPVTGYHRH